MKMNIVADNLKCEALGLMIDAINKWYGSCKVEITTGKDADGMTTALITIEVN